MNQKDYYDYTKLNYIREQIENMTKFNQIEVLRVLTKNKEKQDIATEKTLITKIEITCVFVSSKALKPLIKMRLIEKATKPKLSADKTQPMYRESASEIPMKILWVISGPNNKNATALGTVITPTKRIALTSCALTSSRLPSRANFEIWGRIAVIIEIVTIEYGNNITKYAYV